jgi:hypothetical protein
MSDSPISSGAGYSPDISMELTLDGERFRVASIGPDEVVVRGVRRVPPGRGTLRLVVDRKATMFHIYLPDGLDPDRVRHAYRLLDAVEEAAA